MKKLLGLLVKFSRYLAPYKARYSAVMFMHVAAAALSLVIPIFVKLLIDGVIGPDRADLLPPVVGFMAAAIILRATINYFRTYHGHEIAQRVTYDMRNDLYAHLQNQSMRFYDRERTGNLLTRVIDDLNVVEEATHHAPEAILGAGVLILGSFAVLVCLDWRLSLACLWLMPLQGVAVFRLGSSMHRGFRRVRRVASSLSSKLEESFSGVHVIKSFGREEYELDRFDDINKRHYAKRLDVIRPMSAMYPVAELLNGLAIAIVVGLGGFLSLRGMLAVGTLAVFVLYLRQFLLPMMQLAMSFEQIASFLATSERYFDYLALDPEIRESARAVHLPTIKGEVKFEDVHFSYREGVPVLQGVSFNVSPGTTTALVGPTGSGKTTVIRLLSRLYDVAGGRVTMDGHDIRALSIRTLRNHIGAVMQDDYVFSGTIRDNIAYGRLDASDDEIEEAARQANAEEFILKMPEAYGTVVGQRGVMLSEGQRQRLTIARALLKNPKILLLDEATSSVDSETERLIQEALARLLRGRTTIAIAHRLSTILNADDILYVEDGLIVERGRHDELLAKNGRYARLFHAQFRIPLEVSG